VLSSSIKQLSGNLKKLKLMKIIGIDLAWQSEKNTTALAVGKLTKNNFHICSINESLASLYAIKDTIKNEDNVQGLSIDAPLIINNATSQRPCELELSQEYASRYASCHASNTTLYPNAASTLLSNYLSEANFNHLGNPVIEHWQIECYPHPALIEIFDLPERLQYKKGNVPVRKQGQVNLANHLKSLENSNILKLTIDTASEIYLDEDHIRQQAGAALKRNEDALDSIICAYVGALYASMIPHKTFGNIDTGYIYVPKQQCI